MIDKITLTEHEARATNALLHDVSADFGTPESPRFLNEAAVIAHDLPQRVRKFLNDFRLKETERSAVCIISGYDIDDEKIGLTPTVRASGDDLPQTRNEQAFLVLLSSLLGDPVSWSTQQAGNIVHDVLPVKGQESDQAGSSSKGELFFHTEDAFHPYRGDYLGMMCLRNLNQATTTVATKDSLSKLPEDVVSILFEKRFVIKPDISQFEEHHFNKSQEIDEISFQQFLKYSKNKINTMNSEPEPSPVLFGNKQSPYICVDCPEYMYALDQEAENALKVFRKEFNNALLEVEMEAGEVCFIDNLRAVHGRKPFKYPARYDGTDRWMKRVNIARDLRKSSDMRMSSESRIIF